MNKSDRWIDYFEPVDILGADVDTVVRLVAAGKLRGRKPKRGPDKWIDYFEAAEILGSAVDVDKIVQLVKAGVLRAREPKHGRNRVEQVFRADVVSRKYEGRSIRT